MAHKGTSTFIMQRATAVILLPLGAWLIYSLAAHIGAGYAEARAWVAQPVNGVILGLFVVIGAWHMRIGMEEIILDYIHDRLKPVLQILNWLAASAVILAAVWAVYQISFAG